jgi:class 3 adenylate cyclase
LLHNILPPSIASRKLSGETTIADEYDEASVLFADIVGFTALSSSLSPTELVGMLNKLFARFDRIVSSAGLEKIKTIGDCYMVAAGVPQAQPGHLAKLLRVAVDMLTESESMKAPDGSPILIRIGVHVGPVTAGVIGESKFIFDVWGDTVNVASRMESNGAAGSIQVTEAVVTAMSDLYGFEGPALIDVKGKGPTLVWRLKRRTPRARAQFECGAIADEVGLPGSGHAVCGYRPTQVRSTTWTVGACWPEWERQLWISDLSNRTFVPV